MPERAEIEAVKAALEPIMRDLGATYPEQEAETGALEALEALDSVRDARDDNNGRCRTCGDWVGPDGCERCARAPQGEDHECRDGKHEWAVSGDPATTCVRCGVPWASPPRDGTVAVEEVAAWVRRQAGPLGPYTLADALLAQFSRPEQPEPDALGGLPPSQPKEDQ